VEKIAPEEGGVYVYRPYENVLLFNKYKVIVYKYSGNFMEKGVDPVFLKSYTLKNGSFIALSLAPGYYKLVMPQFKDTFKIIHVKAGNVYYYKIIFFARGFFKKADSFIQEKEQYDAVEEMLRYGGLVKKDTPD